MDFKIIWGQIYKKKPCKHKQVRRGHDIKSRFHLGNKRKKIIHSEHHNEKVPPKTYLKTKKFAKKFFINC